jgi:hypothetical protein
MASGWMFLRNSRMVSADWRSTNRGFFRGPDFRNILSLVRNSEMFAASVALRHFGEALSQVLGCNPFHLASAVQSHECLVSLDERILAS